MSPPLVDLAELISIETIASVWSIITEPPEGKRTSRWNADSIWLSIWKRVNNGVGHCIF